MAGVQILEHIRQMISIKVLPSALKDSTYNAPLHRGQPYSTVVSSILFTYFRCTDVGHLDSLRLVYAHTGHKESVIEYRYKLCVE